jgi:hypothetical protein
MEAVIAVRVAVQQIAALKASGYAAQCFWVKRIAQPFSRNFAQLSATRYS